MCGLLYRLGPEGGDEGGEVIACGSPEEMIDVEQSYTGQYLRRILKMEKSKSDVGNQKSEKNEKA